MAKNYMADVARMLGVELGEEFKMTDYNSLYRFTEKGLEFKRTAGWYLSERLEWLLTGRNKILKLPWQPKHNEIYYRPWRNFTGATSEYWNNAVTDIALKEAGMIFRTAEECEAALPALRKKYLGGDDNV